MIWWTGNGIYALMILLAAFALPLVGSVELFNRFPNQVSPAVIIVAIIIGGGLGGFLCLKLGRKWNRNLPMAQRHTLFSIPVEHWGVMSLVLAGLMTLLPILGLITRLFRA